MDPMLEGKKLNYQHHKNGTTYVYEVLDRYWDKDKKQPRTKQICIGKLDPETGAFIPSKRFGEHGAAAMSTEITAKTVVTGPYLLLERINEEIGLATCLRKASPDHWREILALSWYVLASGQALSHADIWLSQHESPTDQILSSQRISELLADINEDVRQTFFKVWGKKLSAHDYLCYDITSVSSYAEQNEFVRYGYNRDGESLPQINLAMVYGQKRFLPVTYRELPGSVTDVKTLENLIDQFDKLAFSKLQLVLDRGFYSKANVDLLADAGHHFVIAVPTHLRFIREQIDRYRDEIDGPDGLRRIDGEAIYCKTILYPWGDQRRRCYLQIYFTPQRMVDDRVRFDEFILQLEEELLENRPVDEHEEQYRQYFTVKETPKRGRKVSRNSQAIVDARKKYIGFSALLTTKLKDPIEALTVYREKDVVEKCFDDLKNELDMKRLRVHTSQRMKGRTFIQFIAMIQLAQIRKTMRETGLVKRYTAKRLLMELESLTTIEYTGRYKNKRSEMTKAQREIFQAFNVMLD